MIGSRSPQRPARRHLVAADDVAALAPHLGAAGLVLGTVDQTVALEVFRAEATVHGTLVGPLEAAQHVVYGALGLGAVVTVRTTRPHEWGGFARSVDLPRERLSFQPPGTEVDAHGTAIGPHLLLDDDVAGARSAGARSAAASSAWTWHVHHLDAVAEHDRPELARADVLLLHGSTATEVLDLLGPPDAPAGADRSEPPPGALPQESMVVVVGGQRRWVMLPRRPVTAIDPADQFLASGPDDRPGGGAAPAAPAEPVAAPAASLASPPTGPDPTDQTPPPPPPRQQPTLPRSPWVSP